MANTNLSVAKRAKNDEFYTQYNDIQNEIEAYLEYDKDTFKGKVVYCNCDDPLESNFFGFFADNFKRLGLKRLITTSFKPSPVANTLFDLTPYTKDEGRGMRNSDFAARFIIDDVGDHNGDGSYNRLDLFEQLKANKNNEWIKLKGDKIYSAGDFRSSECIELLGQADIVVTNPPFSLYREYVSQLIEYNKKFIIIGSKNTITNKDIFPLIKEDKMWIGTTSFSKDILFIAPKDADLSGRPKTAIRTVEGITYLRSPSVWFTNLDHGRRHQPLSLMSMSDNLKFNKKMQGKSEYDQYDNYDATDVPFTNAIPNDFDGIMGVPISFIDKYNPEQFEIIWQASGNSYANMPKDLLKLVKFVPNVLGSEGAGQGVGVVNGKKVYSRILIRHRKATQ